MVTALTKSYSLVPVKSKGAACLSLTGDLEFNKDLRKRAIQLGMHLNENGLWRFHPRNDDPQTTQESASELPTEEGHWQLIASKTEKSILAELGMPWVEPQKRNFSFLTDSNVRRSKEPKVKTQTKAIPTPSTEVKVKRGRGRPRKT
ncbi:hypothetical protein EIP86_006564 [Pleurotus ostreatoroseus]|nr:hypothetical protein EIP86_006564 [Pleurotus ostreatoroseus]